MNEEEKIMETDQPVPHENSEKKRQLRNIGIICGVIALLLLLIFLLPKCSRNFTFVKRQTTNANGYTSPIDWESLWKKNKDIYAWIEIPVSDEDVKAGNVITTVDSVTGEGQAFISLPVVQNANDDTIYMDRNPYGEYDGYGALFTEHVYNSDDFTDVMTMIYGHRNEYNFGNLQAQYSTADGFAACSTIMIYLPDREIPFKVWAAVPYSSDHILYYTDFTNDGYYAGFVRNVKAITSLSAKFDDEVIFETGDQLIGLSTCLMGNRKNRYIVFGVYHIEETNPES